MKLNLIKEINKEEMTQEEKDILLKDLCARLPHGVKCSFGVDDAVYEITGINPTCCGASEIQATHIKSGINGDFTLNSCKPYLFPLESMTEEQKDEYENAPTYYDYIKGGWTIVKTFNDEYIIPYWFVDFCNKYHFDYRGLIEKDLAINSTGLNIY